MLVPNGTAFEDRAATYRDGNFPSLRIDTRDVETNRVILPAPGEGREEVVRIGHYGVRDSGVFGRMYCGVIADEKTPARNGCGGKN
mgnify:CR=1 FL=1